MFRTLIVSVVCSLLYSQAIPAQSLTEAERKAQTEEMDRQGLRYSTGMVSDSTKDLLRIPDYFPEWRGFTVASKIPTVEFAPIRGLNPEFFPEDNKGLWSQWGEVTKGPNGRYYMATGDHRSRDSQVIITEYDPEKKDQRIVVDVGKLCGWKVGLHHDGKIHGRMDIMEDGTLVAATWLGRDVKPDDIAHGWTGGYMLTYNVFTGVADCLGIPMLNYSWHYHVTDRQTGVFMAIGDGYAEGNAFLAYDVRHHRTLFAGMPPDNIKINLRATLLDERTGLFYSTDSNKENAFFVYDQRTNRFRHLPCSPPANPVTGKQSSLRAYTEYRTPDNIFWCMSWDGTLFKFYPDREQTELVGVNWGPEGDYVTSLALSPKFRYIYYVPGAHGASMKFGVPVVQYDTVTDTRKVIAFLGQYYHDTYGYTPLGTYGVELSEDGSYLVMHMNGAFHPDQLKPHFEYPSIFVVHIPEEERRE